jgi:hypothetical protein
MRKYIGPVKSDNFVYPNNVLEEYDVEIIHDINDNSVSGTTSGFSAVFSGGSIASSFTYIWNKNGAEPFINEFGALNVLSVHMLAPGQDYYKPFRTVATVAVTGITANTVTDTFLFFVTPAQMGLTSFTSGIYNFEIRFIGQKAIYPICQTVSVAVPTPTPTPGPTVTPGGPTPTPTPSPTPSDPCYCYPIVVTGNTLPPPEGGVIATLTYNDCFGTQVVRAFTVGPGTYYQCIQTLVGVVQYNPGETSGIDQSLLNLSYQTGNCRTGYVCTGYEPANTPTPTPTGAPITATPTPTPTGAPPTDTPTPTPTGVPPTDTPTPTPTNTPVPPDCVTSVSFEVDSAGTVSYLNCCGTLVTGFYGIGPQVINDCIDFGTLSGPISSISYGGTSCTCVTPTPTPTATNTPTPTPTATSLACECITIYNEGGTTGNYTITNCNGTEQSPNLLPGANRNHCIQAGSLVIINSGLLTEVYCETSCNVSADCSTCLTPATPTPTPTSTGVPPTNTPTPTPTATISGCTCYSVYNETNDNITFTYNRCPDGVVSSLSAPRGSVRSVCVSAGGDVYDPSGFLTIVDCGAPCNTNGDCEDCV